MPDHGKGSEVKMYTIEWIVDGRILMLRYKGELTSDEMEALSDEFQNMMTDAVAPLHIIEDDRELKTISDLSLSAVSDAFKALDLDKLDTAIAIVPEELEEVTDILGKAWELISDINYERVESMPEALDYLAKHDATLPDRSEWQLALA